MPILFFTSIFLKSFLDTGNSIASQEYQTIFYHFELFFLGVFLMDLNV